MEPLYNTRVQFQLREYREGDFARLWQIDQACFVAEIAYSRAELSHYLRRNGSFTLVAEAASTNGAGAEVEARGTAEIVGFIVAEARRRAGHIITIDVLEGARHLGVGSELLSAAEKRLLMLGCPVVLLETAVDNLPALAFYKRHQYFVAGTLRRYYSNGVDALVLKKDLIPHGPATTLPR